MHYFTFVYYKFKKKLYTEYYSKTYLTKLKHNLFILYLCSNVCICLLSYVDMISYDI